MTRSSLMNFVTRSAYSLLLQMYGSPAMEEMGVQLDFDKLREAITFKDDAGDIVNPEPWEYASTFARRRSEYNGTCYSILINILNLSQSPLWLRREQS